MQDDQNDFLLAKLREPSTYAGLIFLVQSVLPWTIPADQLPAIESFLCLAVGILLAMIRERKGANPCNAPLPPQGKDYALTHRDAPNAAGVRESAPVAPALPPDDRH